MKYGRVELDKLSGSRLTNLRQVTFRVELDKHSTYPNQPKLQPRWRKSLQRAIRMGYGPIPHPYGELRNSRTNNKSITTLPRY